MTDDDLWSCDSCEQRVKMLYQRLENGRVYRLVCEECKKKPQFNVDPYDPYAEKKP